MSRNPNPDPATHSSFPVWNMETWLWEDVPIGERKRSIRRTISEGEAMLFNSLGSTRTLMSETRFSRSGKGYSASGWFPARGL